MGRLNTGHVSACSRERDLIDLPDSGLAAEENYLSNVSTSSKHNRKILFLRRMQPAKE